MKICVVGTGYVGLVAGTCFADSGNDVICVDCDESKIAKLSRGEIPIYEPGLAEMASTNIKAKRLHFTTDLASAAKQSRVIFLAVGTPAAADGSADLSATLAVAREVGRNMDGYRVVVVKSTVPVGTHAQVIAVIKEQTSYPFDYVSNPEFMKEGAALEDFTKPDRVVLGVSNPAVVPLMKQLYGPFMRKSERILITDPASAEMIKYAANAALASRISFMNEIAGLCDHFGADVEAVRRGIGSDKRIGQAFLFPGVGYGGSCFPKDVTALVSMGRKADYPMSIVEAVHNVNLRQRSRFARRIIDHFVADRSGATKTESGVTLAVWGLAFKAKTDDVRESPAIAAIEMFLKAGMNVRAYDPEAMETGAQALGGSVTMCAEQYDMLEGADALVIFTDWPQFRTPDFDLIQEKMSSPLIFDGRNMYDPSYLADIGFHYHCIGRPYISASKTPSKANGNPSSC